MKPIALGKKGVTFQNRYKNRTTTLSGADLSKEENLIN
jgi:hypothetical protein